MRIKTLILPGGTVHAMSADLQQLLLKNSKSLETWNDITPLARNEWICLVESGKSVETKDRRLKRALDQLIRGQRRPCCWAGCPHREKTGK